MDHQILSKTSHQVHTRKQVKYLLSFFSDEDNKMPKSPAFSIELLIFSMNLRQKCCFKKVRSAIVLSLFL